MSRRSLDIEYAYAIVRLDLFHGPNTPLERLYTIKEVVWDRDDAEREVARLNALWPDGKTRYFVDLARVAVRTPSEASA